MELELTISESDVWMPASWRVLTTLLGDSGLSQADLRARTGLSHPVIVQQVARLRQAGLICFGQPLSGRPGRPRIPMDFNWDYRRLLGVEVHQTGITVQATNLAGTPCGDASTLPLSAWTRDAVHSALLQAVREALATPGAEWAGIGIVLPGIVTRDGQTVTECLDLPDWRYEPLVAAVQEICDLPVVLCNHADALARLAWAEAGTAHTADTVMAVSLRHGATLRLGILCEGRLLPGVPACRAGIGHLPVAGNARACRCGRTGCVETLLADATARPEAVRALATAVADAVTILHPDRLVLQGDAAWSEDDTNTLHAVLQERCVPGMVEKLEIDVRTYGAQESLQGILHLLAARVLDFRQGLLGTWAAEASQEQVPVRV